MSNVNSFLGYQNLPTQVIATTTNATPLLVPAQGTYGTLPSPLLPAGGALHLDLGGDILSNATYDGHSFTVRVAGKINVGATGNFTTSLKLGTSTTVANNTVIGSSTAASAVATALTAGAYNFWFEVEFIWDSISQSLTGVASGLIAGTLKAQTAFAPGVSVTLPSAGVSPTFQFLPDFLFSVANAANSVTVTEFLIDRGA